MKIRLTTSRSGKTEAERRPLWMLSEQALVARPTREGPSVPPTSPPRARRAKRAVPPPGMRAEVRLMEPGHMMATARPLTIQPMKAMMGRDEREATR